MAYLDRYKHKAVVVSNGHVDRITGPRCIISPLEGYGRGRMFVAHTVPLLFAGQYVIWDEITRSATLADETNWEKTE